MYTMQKKREWVMGRLVELGMYGLAELVVNIDLAERGIYGAKDTKGWLTREYRLQKTLARKMEYLGGIEGNCNHVLGCHLQRGDYQRVVWG